MSVRVFPRSSSGPANKQPWALLRELGVSHVHYHHLVGHTPEVMHLHEHLGVAYDFTAHDYYSACPQISLTTAQKTYCGEQGLAQCRACVHERPAPTQETIDAWRLRHRLFYQRAGCLCPAMTVRSVCSVTFPQARIRYAPHTDMPEHPAAPVRAPLPLPAPRHLRIFLVGGLSAIKGGDVAEAVALEAARLNAPIELHLLGYVFRTFKAQPEASLTIRTRSMTCPACCNACSRMWCGFQPCGQRPTATP